MSDAAGGGQNGQAGGGGDGGRVTGGQAGEATGGDSGAAGGPALPTRLGLHFTAEELVIWRERASNGPFKDAGDAFDNSPGEWARIAANTAQFAADPAAELWSNLPPVVTPSACSSASYECEPVTRGLRLRDAAFYALLQDDAELAAQVIEILLAQIAALAPDGKAAADFTSDRFQVCTVFDKNPGFIIAEYLLRLVFAYDYVKQFAAATDSAAIETWLSEAAHYLRREVDYDRNQFFVDRSQEDGQLTATGVSRLAGSYFATPELTHFGGHGVVGAGKLVNNRAAGVMRLVGHVGVLLDDRVLIHSAKIFFREWIRYGVYADGVVSEFLRWEDNAPNRGLDYAASNIGHMVDTADVLARAGDPDLFTYETSQGMDSTDGGPKSLLLAMTTFAGYLDGTGPLRYGTDQAERATDIDYLIDGNLRIDNYNQGKQSHRDVWLVEANVFFQSEYLTGIYTRKGPGLAGYPTADKIASAGPHAPWGGVGDTHPSKLFQFGLMEGLVWPYPPPSTPPLQPAYDRTRCDEL